MRVGQKATVKVKGVAEEYEGVVSEIGQSAEKSATSADQDAKVTVKVTITDPDENIKVGYEADAEIITVERLDALRVNYEAVQIEAESGKAYVYVVDSRNRVEKRYIETGLETEYDIEVVDGLVEGERYVADPNKDICIRRQGQGQRYCRLTDVPQETGILEQGAEIGFLSCVVRTMPFQNNGDSV